MKHGWKKFGVQALACSAVMLAALMSSGCASRGDIYVAAKTGNFKKVKSLLTANPALASTREFDSDDGWTPLLYAATHGHKDIVELLLTFKVDVNARDRYGNSPLHHAAEKGHEEVVKVLLTNGAEIDAKGDLRWTPLHWAVNNQHKGVVEILLNGKANVQARGENGTTPLEIAVGLKNSEIADLLRQHGAKE